MSRKAPTFQYSNLISIYFDFSYYLLLSPVRFIVHENEKLGTEIKTLKNIIQKCLCFIYNAIGFIEQIWLCKNLYGFVFSRRQRDTGLYFQIFTAISQQIPCLYFQIGVWLYSRRFEQLICCLVINSLTLQPVKPAVWQRRCFIQFIFSVVNLLIVYETVMFYASMQGSSSYIQTGIKFGRDLLFLNNHQAAPSLTTEQYTIVDYVAGITGFLANLNRMSLNYFAALGFLVSVLTVWPISQQFNKMLEPNPVTKLEKRLGTKFQKNFQFVFEKPLKWLHVKQVYEFVKEVCSLTSSAFGSVITCMLVSQIVLQSTYLDMFIFEKDWKSQIVIIFMSVTTILSVILAAEVVNNVSVFTADNWCRQLNSHC